MLFFQDEVCLTAPCATLKLQINIEKCILCQKKTSSEYLSSGEIGRSNIVSLAKIAENDPRASRVLQLTAQEQGIIKYHTSSCYRNFMRDMAKPDSIAAVPEQSEPSQPEPTSEPQTKRFKASVTGNVCIFCGADGKTVKRTTIHMLYESVKNRWPKNC